MSDTAVQDAAVASGKTFVWHEVYGASSQASIDFYTEALGWEVQEAPMEGMVYKMFVANGRPVAGIMGTNEMPDMNQVPPHWSTYIGVDNVDERLAKVTELGGKLMVGPMDVPTVGRMALVQDPQGATFWLFQGESA